ncbi:MAG: hypothetical protein EAZ36_06890 [Verrucomicrobia bacterium]|nr:MAG: hypothetical protein EAZ36_06890 [Verrucomicrobiota bacterium]
MNRPLSICLICVGIFASGAITGGLAARRLHLVPTPLATPPPPPPQEGFGPNQLRRLSEHLELTATQREQIQPILNQAGDELRQLRRESLRQSSSILETMETAVAERITPQQREKLVVLQEEQRARIRARMEERNRRRAEEGEAEDPRLGRPPRTPPAEGAPPPS